MIDENLEREIDKHRATARTMGEAALEAIGRGDEGMARAAARQAAQWARVVIQLQTGEKQTIPEETESAKSSASPSGKMMV
ncbi:MAG: hypothetical protein ICV60_11605 [Pyrinomonadaceae bacterium]|nr:hypothetical protein [Pyrinomonadaceae bacterium]